MDETDNPPEHDAEDTPHEAYPGHDETRADELPGEAGLPHDLEPLPAFGAALDESPVYANDVGSLKTLPNSLQAEQSLLGSIMVSTEAWDLISDKVSAGDFYSQKHAHIFSELARLADAAEPFDLVTLSESLERRGQLDAAGGMPYLVNLLQNTPSAANIIAYADIVHDRATLRRIITTSTEIQNSAFNPKGRSASEILDGAERLMMQVGEAGLKKGGPVAVDELMNKALDKIEELWSRKGAITGLSTGFIDLDEKTSGLQEADLVIVAGRPSMGKTSFAMNLVEHAVLNSDQPILVFSMEMPAHSLMMRMLSSLGKIDQTRVRNGQLEDDDWRQLGSAMHQLKNRKLFIDDTPALTPTELRSRARRVAREHGKLGMIMVDYLQLMQVAGSNEGRTQEISEISRNLKSIAKEFSCPMVALSQLNRGLEQRPNKRPVMSDLRESGAIEQDADLIMFIYRDEVYNEDTEDKGVAEIIIGKQRNGPIGTSRLAFLGQFTRFENLATRDFDA